MTDFFISYTGADQAWAEWIGWVLEEAGYSVTIQAWDFRPGGNFAVDMQKATEDCERTIAVLSPDYVKSDYATPEWAAAFAQDPTGMKKTLLPVRVRDVKLKGMRSQIVYIDLVGLDETTARDRLLAGAERGRAKPKTKPNFPGLRPAAPFPGATSDDLSALPVAEIPAPGPLPPGSRMPFAINPLFVGRQEDLRTLARQLKAGETSAVGQIAAATGLGGIGKTQLASEFVHRYGRFFEGGVFWMSFADPAAVPAEVAACGRSLGLHPSWDGLPLDRQIQLVEETWSQSIPRLLVFDNCEEEALLRRWRPRTGGTRVLLTSRRDRWDRALGVKAVPLTILPRPVSVELLRKFRPDVSEDDVVLSKIAAELGDLPLALHLAGSFMDQFSQAAFGQPAAYLESLRKGGLLAHPSLQGKFTDALPTEHEKHVGRTFALSVDRLNQEDPTDALALALLARAAYFAPGEPIPRELLLKTLELDEEDLEVPIRAEKALGRLTVLGLLEQGGSGSVLMHRLVAELAQESVDAEAARVAVEESLFLEANRLNQTGYPVPLVVWQPHLRAVVEEAQQREDERAARLCNELGGHLGMIGDFSGALPYVERALEIWQAVLGPEHPNTAAGLNHLGFVLKSQGDLAGARPSFERALAIQEKVLGAEHPETARSLNNLGALLESQGDFAGARSNYERALASWGKVLGTEHPDTALSLNNLGGLLESLGDLAGARLYYERALAIQEKVLSAEHQDTALSLNNLGFLLQNEGDLAGARSYYERALAIWTARLGPNHPRTKIARGNLETLGPPAGEDPPG